MGIRQITLEQVLNSRNMHQAMRTVVANRGAPGIDNMDVDSLETYIRANPYMLTESIKQGTFKPSPIRRVYIPKDNGEQRPLGIPTVVDRLVQQAIVQVLSAEYEQVFSPNSFGYRPNRGCHDAINQALLYINQGNEWIIDLDLSKFFDNVNHSKLLQILSDSIKYGRVISLIHRFLRAPIFENGKIGKANTIGTPQGGCISPVLANILLNELDQQLDARQIKFVRYADDMLIMCKTRRTAERVLVGVTKFIENKLFLKINREKTKIGKVSESTQFLGFGFTRSTSRERKRANPNQKWFAVTHKKKLDKFVSSVKVTLNRRAPGGIERVKQKLKQKLTGWVNYFGNSIPIAWQKQTDGWIRRRIRQLLWKQWKTPQNRQRQFSERWQKAPELGEYAYSSARYWRMAATHQINTALSNKTLMQEGWTTLGTFTEYRYIKHPVR